MIYQLTDLVDSIYDRLDFSKFITWFRQQNMYQLDVETDVTQQRTNKTLISVQIGSCYGDRNQYFLQWSALSHYEQDAVLEVLNDPLPRKIGHGINFEYILFKGLGVYLENMYCTRTAEKVLRGGMENTEYSLEELTMKYLRKRRDKTLQTSFGDNIMTDPKILYGCEDVEDMYYIMKVQLEQAVRDKLMNVIGLEMDVLPAFGDISYEGMILDIVKWRENIKLSEPVVQEAKEKLDAWILKEPFRDFAIGHGYIWGEDRIEFNEKSTKDKLAFLQLRFPSVTGTGRVLLKKFMGERKWHDDPEGLAILVDIVEKGDWSTLSTAVIATHRDTLITMGMLIPAGQVTISWSSPKQVLELFQCADRKLKGVGKDDIANFHHPIVDDFREYNEAAKLLSSFGEEFIHKYVDNDGRVRCSFNQVISTGRCSCSNPNFQQIPAKVGNRYRNAFRFDPGWYFVDGDYVSQELVLIAYLSNDPVWNDCLKKGEDLHSVCASLVFKRKWKMAADNDCAFYKMVINDSGMLVEQHQKCKCHAHKKMRDHVKSINFGLAYGMSKFKLARTMQSNPEDAQALIDEYFETFPNIGITLEQLGLWGLHHGWIQTPAPFFRKRWFPYWYENRAWIDAHVRKIQYIKQLGSIERQAKNQPIQGAAADIVKCAMVLVRNYLKEYNLRDDIKIVAQVHDQITTVCRGEELAKWWKPILQELMEEAGRVVVKSNLLKAEVNITNVWTK